MPGAEADPLELRVTGGPERAPEIRRSRRACSRSLTPGGGPWRVAARLRERADIKALKLTPGHLEAFTAVLMDVVEPASDAPQNGRIAIVARLDEESAAGMIHASAGIRT